MVSTARKRTLFSIISTNAWLACSRGKVSTWGFTPVRAEKSMVSSESIDEPLGQPATVFPDSMWKGATSTFWAAAATMSHLPRLERSPASSVIALELGAVAKITSALVRLPGETAGSGSILGGDDAIPCLHSSALRIKTLRTTSWRNRRGQWRPRKGRAGWAEGRTGSGQSESKAGREAGSNPDPECVVILEAWANLPPPARRAIRAVFFEFKTLLAFTILLMHIGMHANDAPPERRPPARGAAPDGVGGEDRCRSRGARGLDRA